MTDASAWTCSVSLCILGSVDVSLDHWHNATLPVVITHGTALRTAASECGRSGQCVAGFCVLIEVPSGGGEVIPQLI